MKKGYGKSAFVRNCEIYSTDGKAVDLDADMGELYEHLTVGQFVEAAQAQPHIVIDNKANNLLWFIGIPVICLIIIGLVLWMVGLLII